MTKRTLAAVTAILLAMTATRALGSDIRVDNGRDIIRAGDPASKLARYLGSPVYAEYGRVCVKPAHSRCSKSRSGRGRIYQYRYDDLYYTIEVYDGTITRIEWSR